MRPSVLIVSYGTRERLRRCLASIDPSAQIVVVDNASPDDSAEMVRVEFPRVELVAWPENRGFSAGVNEAARIATGELLLLLNPDCVLGAGALDDMSAALAALPDAQAVGFRQLDEEGRYQLTVGPPPSFALELVRRTVQRRLDRGDTRLGRLIDRVLRRPVRVPWVAGSVLLVRRDAFERVGGFDERFFLYFEDIDFCLRVASEAGPVYYDPSVTVTHVRGASASRAPDLARRAYRDSQLHYWRKHRGSMARAIVRVYQRLAGVA